MTKNRTYDLTTVKGRLLEFLRHERLSQVEFAERLGVSPTYIGAMRKGLSADKMLRLSELFPRLNREWLAYGVGEMLLDAPQAPAKEKGVAKRRPKEERGDLVPLLPVEAFAGSLQEWSRAVRREECEEIHSPVRQVDFAIRISGDSMEPEFSDGTTLFVRKITDRNFMPWGHPVVFDTSNGVIFKLIYPGDEDAEEPYVEARSLNPRYPAMRIATDTLHGIYKVCAAVRIYNTI